MKVRKVTIRNIIAYLQGKIRYRLYYSRFKWLIRSHIKEQIEMRINSMDRKCYEDGQCKLCGCQTTALQMANKACDKPCYPEMLNKSSWKWLKTKNENRVIRNGYWWTIENNKFKKDE